MVTVLHFVACEWVNVGTMARVPETLNIPTLEITAFNRGGYWLRRHPLLKLLDDHPL